MAPFRCNVNVFFAGSADLLGSFNTNDIEPPSYEAARDLLGLDKDFESRGRSTSGGNKKLAFT